SGHKLKLPQKIRKGKPAPAPTKKPSKHKLPQKIRKGKPTFQLVDEDDEAQQESIPQEEGDDPDLELAKKMSSEAHQEKGEGEGDDADMERAIKLSLDPTFLPQGQEPVGGVTIRDPVSETTPKLLEVVGKGKAIVTEEQVAHSLIDLETESETETAAPKGDKDQGEVDSSTVTSRASIPVSVPEKAHEALARPDPEPMQEDQTGSDSGKLHVRDPEPCKKTRLYQLWKISTPPPINTEATTITTSLPEITLFIALQLRVTRLEQEMSEVKKTDHSADVLDLIKSQVPTVVDKYLGTKLDDALLRILERHTADLIEKYSVLPGLESIKNQESEKSPKEIIRIKKEQGEEKQDSTYSIRSTNKVALEEFDLKTYEDAMDKEVKDRVKTHKRKHDSDDDDEEDDDDEGPSAGSNQGKSAKRRRHDSGASGLAQPPIKDDEQSSKKPWESDASASKQHPALTSTGWQITDTRDASVDSSMHRSNP
ncbi:hypothetical protein Tco_1046611, partial [Tanacetum coccineum]